ncbi:MAG: MBL fold metallo-hydrolase, partial [Candidatus Aenigmarchaeota archaeon]|nr:MBL fold metallo-hydrolase [Candidatus Aenigmarchaeota archaeon]
MIKRLGDIILIQLSDMDSNIYLIGDVAIDSGTGFNFTRLKDILRVLKKGLGDFKQVVNTHGHFDHVGGDGYFLNAKIAIHENDAEIVEKGDAARSVADFFDGKLNPRKVDTKLKEKDVIKAGAYSFEVIHTPGHTPGS